MPVVINGDTGITQSGEFDSDSTMGFKNRIINGGMMVNQRGGVISASGQTNTYGVDRFAMRTTSGSAVVSMEQSTVAPTGFYNSLLCTVTTADASLASGDLTALHQKIEGVNVPDIAWGTASAKSVTISFQVRSSLTGTYGVGIQNDASNRSYPSTFTINSANTWESKTVTIPGDTTGTWNLGTTSTALYVFFSLSAGSDFTSGTTNAWNAADRRGASGQVNWCATNGNTFYITGVQLEVGTVATSFDQRSISTELGLCYRYCFALRTDASGYTQYGRFPPAWTVSTTGANFDLFLPTPMRNTAYSVTYNNKQYELYFTTSGTTGQQGNTMTLNTDANGINWVNITLAASSGSWNQNAIAGFRFSNATDAALVISTEL